MFSWNSYVQNRMQDMMTEAETERLLKTALSEARTQVVKRSMRESIGERLILTGWRMMNKQPQEGESCSRLVLSGHKQAIVMVEVCA